MKGNDKVIAVLNQLLADELTAISQYMVHSEMCDNWGYEKLHKAIEHQAMETVQQVADIANGRLPAGAVNAPHAHRWSTFTTRT